MLQYRNVAKKNSGVSINLMIDTPGDTLPGGSFVGMYSDKSIIFYHNSNKNIGPV